MVFGTCFDGIQDGDEAGIDCGGNCDSLCQNNRVELRSNTNVLIDTFSAITECADNIAANQTCLIYPGNYDEELIPMNSGNYSIAPIKFVAKEGMGSVNVSYINLDRVDWVYIDNLSSRKLGQWGMNWTFDKHYLVGAFVNGDYWVKGPVKIVGFSPPSIKEYNVTGHTEQGGEISFEDWTKNGAQINPDPKEPCSGYDSRYRNGCYNYTLNVAYGVNETNPLEIDYDASLISSISRDEPNRRPQVKTQAILTVLSSIPEEGSFRPAYTGTNKSIKYNIRDIDLSYLQSVDIVANSTRLKALPGDVNEDESNGATYQWWDSVQRMFERPCVDHVPDWTGGHARAIENCKSYGREFAVEIGLGALMLNSNYSLEDKSVLLVEFLQWGIDYYGIVRDGGIRHWGGTGGWSQGRKFPILFAGLLFNDQNILAIANKSGDYLYEVEGYGPGNPPEDYIAFDEDAMTFYVEESDVYPVPYTPYWYKAGTIYEQLFFGHGDLTKQLDIPDYTTHHVGMPEWGIERLNVPKQDSLDWTAPYRQCCTAYSYTGFILAAYMMGMKELWNHDAMFDYQDRYIEVSSSNGLYPGYQYANTWTQDMWDAYRGDYGNVWTETDYNDGNGFDFVAPNPPNRLLSSVQTTNSITLAWQEPDVARDNDTATSYRIIKNSIDIFNTSISATDRIEDSYNQVMLADNLEEKTFTDTSLEPDTYYFYRVYSLDKTGIQSQNAGTIFVSTLSENIDLTNPSKVSNISFTFIGTTKVSFEWEPSIDEESEINHYNIYRNGLLHDITTDTTYTDIYIEPGTYYEYEIEAMNSAGLLSEMSDTFFVTSKLENLVLRISFDDDTISDVSEYENEVIQNEDLRFVDGMFGRAIDTSYGDSITILYSPILGDTEERTICMWGNRFVEGGDGYEMLVNGGALMNVLYPNYIQFPGGSIRLSSSPDGWHHYCLSFNNGLYEFYFDGVKESEYLSSLTKITSTMNFLIGQDMWNIHSPFNGEIDEIRIYRRVLTPDEIYSIYELNALPIPGESPSCYDGVQNVDEAGIDCGGSCPAECIPDCTLAQTNTTWSGWIDNSSCRIDDKLLQIRNLTQYDANNCGGYSNQTFYETQDISCNYCSYNVQNTTWSDWANISCLPDDTMNQSRFRTEYDSNYDSCYTVTSQESDLWNSGSNITYYEFQNVLVCEYCSPSLTNTSWSNWINTSCSQSNLMNQSRLKIQYDENYCGEISNQTFYEYQLNGDCIFSDNQPAATTAYLNGRSTYSDRWRSSNISITFTCSDNVACDATYYCIDHNNTCNPWSGSKYIFAFNHTLDGIYYLRYASNDSWSNVELNHSIILKKAEAPPIPRWNRYQNNDTTDFNSTPLVNANRISVGVPNIAKVIFNSPVDLVQYNGTDFVELDFNTYVNISSKKISVNSSALPMLNTSANLTFYNITYKNPQVEKDGNTFTNYTTLQSPNSSNNHTLIINVSSFSTYEVVEGPYCGDDVCDNDETSSTCSADCSSGGSSGGGSGSSAPALPPMYLTIEDSWTEYRFSRMGVVYFNISDDLYRAVFSKADTSSLTFKLHSTSEVYSVTVNQLQQIDINDTAIDLIYIEIIGSEITLKVRLHKDVVQPEPQIIEIENNTLPQTPSPEEVLESLQPDIEEPASSSNDSAGSRLLSFITILLAAGVLGTSIIYYNLHKTTVHKRINLMTLSKKHKLPEEHVEKVYQWLFQCHVKNRLEEGVKILKEKGWKEELIEEIKKMF